MLHEPDVIGTSAQVWLPLSAMVVVGGIGDGSSGGGQAIACGSLMMPSDIWAPDWTLTAVMAPAWHVPTPLRGVESDPLTIVWPPCSCMLPLVPTCPPYASVTGYPPENVMLAES